MFKSVFLVLPLLFGKIFSGFYDYVGSTEVSVDLLEGVIMNDTAYTFSKDYSFGNINDWLYQKEIKRYYKSKAEDICFLVRTRSTNYTSDEKERLSKLLKLALWLDCEEYKEIENEDLLEGKLTGAIAVDYGLLEINSFDLATLEKLLPEEAFEYTEYWRSSSSGSKKVIRKEVVRGKASNIFSVDDLRAWFEQPMIKEYFQSRARGICDVLDFREETYNYYTPETIRVRDSFLSELGITCKKSELSK